MRACMQHVMFVYHLSRCIKNKNPNPILKSRSFIKSNMLSIKTANFVSLTLQCCIYVFGSLTTCVVSVELTQPV